MQFTLGQIAEIIGATVAPDQTERIVHHLVTDTRLPFRPNSLFLALNGHHYRGARFLPQAFERGALAAVVGKDDEVASVDGPLLVCEDTLAALRAIARAHREQHRLPLVAITGSNGKTILKDFLATLLNQKYRLAVSPGSYNSHVGIALSLLQLQPQHELALIEVGVSAHGEMEQKEVMVRPDFGILTNIGLAHLEGFGSRAEIAREKLKLMRHIPSDGWALLPDDPLIHEELQHQPLRCRTYIMGKDPALPRMCHAHNLGAGKSSLGILYPDGSRYEITLPIDFAFKEVLQTCLVGLCAAQLLGLEPGEAVAAAEGFNPPLNRIEIWKSPLGSVLVNDSYSADPVSTSACLQVYSDYPTRRKICVFGGMNELGSRSEYEHRIVGEELARQKVDLLLVTGTLAQATADTYQQRYRQGQVARFSNVSELAIYLERQAKSGDIIVVKGPHGTGLDQVAIRFKARLTQSVYYIDLARIRENIKAWREHLQPNTHLLVMIKALAYGADATQLASFLQTHVNYFGVAYTKEAIALRANGIRAEILVQLVLPEDVEDTVRLNLQPVILDADVARMLSESAQRQGKTLRVHLEVDTGMGRFGVFPKDVGAMAQLIQRLPGLQLHGLMTHFSSADDPDADGFSREQIQRFEQVIEELERLGMRPPLCHAAATAAAARFPEAHFDMVRVGLGIYGIYPSPAVAEAIPLKCPLALVSKVGNIKEYPKGYPISYNRTYITERESRIAYLPIGYHDGLSRRWGGWQVVIRGRKAPIVGAVCMDFTPVDVTDIPDVEAGDEALIFGEWHGERNPVEALAEREGTIPYEIMCRLSGRIQRIYLREG